MVIEYLVNIKKLTAACLDRSLFTFENWGQFARDFLHLAGNEQYAVRFDNNVRMFLRPNTSDKWVIQETILQDDYRLQAMNLKNATVVDLGANIGVVSISAAARGASHVYAYEPAPANFELLQKNVAANGMESVIRTFNMAATDQETTIEFYLDSANPSGNSMYERRGTRISVQGTTLSRIFEVNGISSCDLLKMDIEGAEFSVLYSTPPELFLRIKRIYLECHKDAQPRHNNTDLSAFLRQQGYRVEISQSIDWRISRLSCERA
jgi:FkbM family methyltransferase